MSGEDLARADRCEECNAPDWDCPCALADNAATGQGDE